MRKQNMRISPAGLGPCNDCAGETHLVGRERNLHHQTRNCLTVTRIASWSPDGCLILR
jgi:hypothetical protein